MSFNQGTGSKLLFSDSGDVNFNETKLKCEDEKKGDELNQIEKGSEEFSKNVNANESYYIKIEDENDSKKIIVQDSDEDKLVESCNTDENEKIGAYKLLIRPVINHRKYDKNRTSEESSDDLKFVQQLSYKRIIRTLSASINPISNKKGVNNRVSELNRKRNLGKDNPSKLTFKLNQNKPNTSQNLNTNPKFKTFAELRNSNDGFLNRMKGNNLLLEENKCFICKNLIKNRALIYPCYHEFCLNCIRKHNSKKSNSNNCPNCNKFYARILYNIHYEAHFDEISVKSQCREKEEVNYKDAWADGREQLNDADLKLRNLEASIRFIDDGLNHLNDSLKNLNNYIDGGEKKLINDDDIIDSRANKGNKLSEVVRIKSGIKINSPKGIWRP